MMTHNIEKDLEELRDKLWDKYRSDSFKKSDVLVVLVDAYKMGMESTAEIFQEDRT